MHAETLETVRTIVAEIMNLPLDDVQASTTQADTPSWTSLNHLNLVLSLEQEFNRSISPEESERLTSVESIVALVSS